MLQDIATRLGTSPADQVQQAITSINFDVPPPIQQPASTEDIDKLTAWADGLIPRGLRVPTLTAQRLAITLIANDAGISRHLLRGSSRGASLLRDYASRIGTMSVLEYRTRLAGSEWTAPTRRGARNSLPDSFQFPSVKTIDRLQQLADTLQKAGLGIPTRLLRGKVRPNTKLISVLIDVNPATLTAPNTLAHIDRLASQIGTSSVDEVRAAIGTKFSKLSFDVPLIRKATRDELGRLVKWGDELASRGLKVPSYGTKGFPISAIARELGIRRSLLCHGTKAASLIEELAHRLGTMPFSDYQKQKHGDEWRLADEGSRFKYQRNAIARLTTYLAHLEATGGYVRESKRYRGTPAYYGIYEDAGIKPPTGAWVYARASLERVVDEAARRIGIGPERFLPSDVPLIRHLTYEQAADIGKDAFAGLAASTRRRLASTLKKIRSHADRAASDPIGSELTTEFPETSLRIARSISNPGTRRHFLAAAQQWAELLAPYLGTECPDLAGTLLNLMRRHGYESGPALADRIGADSRRVRRWLRGDEDAVTGDHEYIPILENLFSLEPGYLSTKVGPFAAYKRTGRRTLLRAEDWPEFIRDNHIDRGWVRPLLPTDFVTMPMAKREEICRSLVADLDSQIPYRIAMKGMENWRLRPLPEPVNTELAAWARFMSQDRVKPGMSRNSHWASPETARIKVELWRTVLSAAVLRPEDGGLGMRPDDLSLAMFSSTDVVDWYIEWARRRAEGKTHGGIISFIQDICSLLRPKTGFLYQSPELAAHLVPVPDPSTGGRTWLLSADDARRLRDEPAAWREHCRLAWESNIALRELAQDKYEVRRNPFAPIDPILDMERPVEALDRMAEAMFEALPARGIGRDIQRAIAVRDLLIFSVFVELTLRLKNVAQLTYMDDNKGMLRRGKDGYEVVIAATTFKNGKGPFFKEGRKEGAIAQADVNYHGYLPSRLTPLFDEYLDPDNGLRKLLVAQEDKPRNPKRKRPHRSALNALWIGQRGEPLVPGSIANTIVWLTWVHLAHHPALDRGIPGVEAFGPHAIRHIIATHILKTTKNPQRAADQLQDAVETVLKIYVKFLPKDKTNAAQAALNAHRRPPTWRTAA
jgi:GNAT superfamily N-acetyltransferase